MPKTQAQILADARERLDESTAAAWTDPELRRWTNQACREIATRTLCLQDTDTLAVTAGDGTYVLPTDMIRIYRIEYTPTGSNQPDYPLDFRHMNSMDDMGYMERDRFQSIPRYYNTWGYPPTVALTIFPTPSEAGTLTFYYYRLPAELATADASDANDNIDLPEGWEDAVVDYVEYKALRKDRDARWQEVKTLFEEKVAEFQYLASQWSDQSDYISNGRTPYSWFGGMW